MNYETKVWLVVTAVTLGLAGGAFVTSWRIGQAECDGVGCEIGNGVGQALLLCVGYGLLAFAAVAGFVAWRLRRDPE